MFFYPLLATFGHIFFQWLGVTRASDRPPCYLRSQASCCLIISMLIRKGVVSYVATKKTPNVFLSVRYRVTRATAEDTVVNN